MNIILVPILAWLIALGYQYFENLIQKPTDEQASSRKAILTGIWILLASYIIISGIQAYFIYNQIVDDYWFNYYLGGIEVSLSTISSLFALPGWLTFQLPQINATLMALFVFWGLILGKIRR